MKRLKSFFVVVSSMILLASCSKQIEPNIEDSTAAIKSITKDNPNVKITTLAAAGGTIPNALSTAKKMSIEEFRSMYSKMEALKNHYNNSNDSFKVKVVSDGAMKITTNAEGNEGPDDGTGPGPVGIPTGNGTTYFNKFPYSSPGGGMGVYLYYNLNASRQVINPNIVMTGLGFDVWQPLFSSNAGFNPQTGVSTFSLTGALISNIGNFVVVVVYTYDISVNPYTMTARIVGVK